MLVVAAVNITSQQRTATTVITHRHNNKCSQLNNCTSSLRHSIHSHCLW